jgi:uncharacterized membrane protein YeaQ/YmgE (transglycosylase-associated protein family)
MILLLFIAIGVVAGLLARGAMPGPTHLGTAANIALGVVGSLAGGLIGSLFIHTGLLSGIHVLPVVLSVVGAFVVTRARRFAQGH